MYVTAILMGLAGGLHCAGMCGPLVLAATARSPFAGAKIIYNLGRVLTYSILGMIAAGIGGMFQIANYQNFLAYLLGGVLILIGFGVISGLKVPLLAGLVNKFTMWLKKQFGSFLQRKENIFYLGMLNGLLPCGLTYLALTFCFTLSYAFEGFLFMLVFGLGTIPVMAGLSWVVGIVLKKIRISYQRVSMVVMIVVGSLLIGRVLFSQGHHHENSGQKAMANEEVICR